MNLITLKTKETKILLLTLIFSLSLSLSIIFVGTYLTKLVFAATLLAVLLILIEPRAYFILFFTLRPTMDLLADKDVLGSANIASIATVLLIFVGGIILLKKDNLKKIEENRVLTNINRIFICLLFIGLVSMLNTADLKTSSEDWLRLFSIIVILNYAFVYFGSEEKFKTLFLVLAMSSIPSLCLGLCQFIFRTGNEFSIGYNRIFGTFVHPAVYAQYLFLIIMTTLYFLRVYKAGTTLKTVLYLFTILAIFELYQTYARGTWIIFAICLAIFGLTYKRNTRLAFYILIFIILAAVLPHVQERFYDIQHSKPGYMNSWEWRIMVWSDTKEKVLEHPVIGHGLGMYEKTFRFMAHNDYLRLIYEIGILGLSAYLLFLLYILFKSIRVIAIAGSNIVKNRHFLISCLIIGLLIISVADNLARSTVVFAYLFCIIGALLDRRGTENTLV